MKQVLLYLILIITLSNCNGKTEYPTTELAINLDEVKWGEPSDGSIAPAGTRTALQSENPNTGGISYYAWFPAGGYFDKHWHTHDEYVTVVSGELTIGLGTKKYDLKPGAFVVIPGRMHHYWDIPETGDAIILVKREGPPDFHFVDR